MQLNLVIGQFVESRRSQHQDRESTAKHEDATCLFDRDDILNVIVKPKHP